MSTQASPKPCTVVRREDLDPICPHCSESLKKLWFRRIRSVLGKQQVYFCPRCKKVLGVAYRKGFWMG